MAPLHRGECATTPTQARKYSVSSTQNIRRATAELVACLPQPYAECSRSTEKLWLKAASWVLELSISERQPPPGQPPGPSCAQPGVGRDNWSLVARTAALRASRCAAVSHTRTPTRLAGGTSMWHVTFESALATFAASEGVLVEAAAALETSDVVPLAMVAPCAGAATAGGALLAAACPSDDEAQPATTLDRIVTTIGPERWVRGACACGDMSALTNSTDASTPCRGSRVGAARRQGCESGSRACGARLRGFSIILMLNDLNRVLVATGLCLCLAACASTPSSPGVATAAGSASSKPQPGCVETGSRIPGDCAAVGRAYDQRDIRTTGQTEAGSAIRMLDPSVTLPGR
jgi:hypothetical protein